MHNINFSYEPENLLKLLMDSQTENSKVTHYDLADWCEGYSRYWHKIDEKREVLLTPQQKSSLKVAESIDCQWELYVTSSFSLKELRELDFHTVSMPTKWINDWIIQLTNNKNE